jgi:prolyl-tRNA editing enzyme YbaK/EbsC (Cys-tRNA(Pro) deacylase)
MAMRAHLTGKSLRSSIDVHNRLLADDVPHELSALPGTLRDLAAAPDVLGLPAVAVAQPTVFADAHGAVVVLAPAGLAVDETGVAVLLGRDGLAPVAPDQAPGLTGYLLPFVPPVALECPVTVLVDERLAGEDVVYTAAGEPGVILKVRGCDLVKATSAVVTQVTKVVDGPR